MSTQTNDQYAAVVLLEKWYRKYSHQFIEISGAVGTGIWEVIQDFVDELLDPREVMYLSYDQHQVLELAAKGFHSYYLNGIIYKYDRVVNFDSLPVINPHANGILDYHWIKSVRKKVDTKYRLMVVFDSILLNRQTINDLGTFGLPVILVRDPMLPPAPDSHTFLHEPNIVLREVHPVYARSPIVHFAHKILNGDKLIPGSYDTVSIVPKKQMNLYNLKSADMIVTITEDSRAATNSVYRERVMHRKDTTNVVGERIIVMETMYGERLVNPDNKRVKVYLSAGSVGTISKINRHAAITKYVPMNFKPEFYHEEFEELYLDRHYLNGVETNSRQVVPDEILKAQYAYALTPQLARYGHWDKTTVLIDPSDYPPEIQKAMIYTAITRAQKSTTIVI